jgi:hypothetical protein
MDYKTFFKKWRRSIGYAILAVAICYALVVQNNNTKEIEKLVKANSEQIARNDEQDCLFTQNSRKTVREVFFSVLDEFPPSDGVESIRDVIEEKYPPIICPPAVPGVPTNPVPDPTISNPEGTNVQTP